MKAYATKLWGSDNYGLLHEHNGIPVYETDEGNERLRQCYSAFSKSIDEGLKYVVIDINPLIIAGLIEERIIKNFH